MSQIASIMDNQVFIDCQKKTNYWSDSVWQISKKELTTCRRYVDCEYLSMGQVQFMRAFTAGQFQLSKQIYTIPKITDPEILKMMVTECDRQGVELKNLHYIKIRSPITAIIDMVIFQINDLGVYQKVGIARVKNILKNQN